MEKLDEAFAGITAPCCNPDEACACSGAERVLRVYAYRSDTTLPAMTEDQRTACLDEIGAVEGYDRDQWVGYTDAQLAGSWPLSGWKRSQ
ncbi:hypothetical protein ACM8BJ_23920 [Pseudomonas aeruginosa]|nr:hypothetical protein [Pseudomonas aeruginosa]MDY1219140.1 hypothetical protein [Pseudomonas aeruginosa]